MHWKRTIIRIVFVLLILMVLVATLAYFTLRSQKFHEYVRAKIIEKAAEATGGLSFRARHSTNAGSSCSSASSDPGSASRDFALGRTGTASRSFDGLLPAVLG